LDQALQESGRSSKRVAGRRVTARKDLELAIQVWRGTLSVSWVSSLSRQGMSACGICGADGITLRAHRRPLTNIVDDNGDVVHVDFGYVGDLDSVNTDLLQALLAANVVPVVSPLAIDSVSGQMFNVNADTVASEVATALKADWLVLLASIPGLLLDIQDSSTRIAKIAVDAIPKLIEDGVISGGMRPKVAALSNALNAGVGRAIILDGRSSDILNVLVNAQDAGTELWKRTPAECSI